MRKVFLLIILFLFVKVIVAQHKENQRPEFFGGDTAMVTYLTTSIRYPKLAYKLNKEGKIKVKFLLLEDGTITDVQAMNHIGYGLDEEAVRVVQNMPKWKPAIIDGKPVEVHLVLPIVFEMGKEKSKKAYSIPW